MQAGTTKSTDMDTALDAVAKGIEEVLSSTEPAVNEPPPVARIAERLAARPEAAAPLKPLSRTPPFTPSTPPVAKADSGNSEIERFLASTDRMRETVRQRMIAEESRYEIERVKMADGYRVKMRELEHEATEALRLLDQEHEGKASELNKLLDLLSGMRST